MIAIAFAGLVLALAALTVALVAITWIYQTAAALQSESETHDEKS
ncbi:hypothetical protein [Tomitella biformata]|nr:hypothetical protein [Tomitella biformata]